MWLKVSRWFMLQELAIAIFCVFKLPQSKYPTEHFHSFVPQYNLHGQLYSAHLFNACLNLSDTISDSKHFNLNALKAPISKICAQCRCRDAQRCHHNYARLTKKISLKCEGPCIVWVLWYFQSEHHISTVTCAELRGQLPICSVCK